MGLLIRDNGGTDFKAIPEGVHIAVCNLVCDLGVQPGGRFKPRQKLYIRWEIPAERVDWEKDGVRHQGPAQIGKNYTASLSQKAKLRSDLENWRGRAFTAAELAGFDVFNILGAACQIAISHTAGEAGKVYANVTGVMGLPKGVQKPKAEKPLIKWSPSDTKQFNELPGWLQQKISESAGVDPRETVSKTTGDEDFDDDIPF